MTETRLKIRQVAGPVVYTLLTSVILFIASGDWNWWLAWIYVFLSAAIIAGSRVIVLRNSPDLLVERAHHDEVQDVKPWDKKLVPFIALYGPLAMLVVAGLDRRFGWTPELPPAVSLVALIVGMLGSLFGSWAFVVNRFFSAVVRIQAERGHTVCTRGPYRVVRHPGYAGGGLYYLATPLVLNSYWAFIPLAITLILMVVRTSLEDKTLQAELPGYLEYAADVKYRLVPGIW